MSISTVFLVYSHLAAFVDL